MIAAALGPVAGGRYGGSPVSTISIALIGLIAGYLLLGMTLWVLAGAVVLFVGEIPGVGHPKGYAADGYESGDGVLEWWQPEILRHRPYWSLALRGAIFGAPSVLFAWWQPTYLLLIPAFAVALPAGMWLATRRYGSDTAWIASEALQYPIALAVLAVLSS